MIESIDADFNEWLSTQDSHGLCLGGHSLEEEILARAAWHAAGGSKLSWAESYNLSTSSSRLCRGEKLDHRWVDNPRGAKEYCSKCGCERSE